MLEGYLQKQYTDVMTLLTADEVLERMTLIRGHLVTQTDKAFDTLDRWGMAAGSRDSDGWLSFW